MMKFYNSLTKIILFSVIVCLLSNCATNSKDSSESLIVVTGSQILTSEILETPNYLSIEIIKPNSLNSHYQIFKNYGVNPTISTEANPISTFAMDVDDASYKLALAMLHDREMPDEDGIRIEEFINAMTYQYQNNQEDFSISAEAMPSPFRQGYHVLHMGIQTKIIDTNERAPSNIVLVADISGSMADNNKLALLKQSMIALVTQLNIHDTVSLVTYNEEAAVKLKPISVRKIKKIIKTIQSLQAGGSTNAENGLIKGYQVAEKMFNPNYNNRVILTSDGMANVGNTTPEAILTKIQHYKEKGIYLTTVGVGKSMYNDWLLEQLANQGNGHYLYIANQQDIQQAFVDDINAQLQTIARDAKIQVEFNPEQIANYRLLGYENRHLETKDFLDTSKDGGELGSGHRVTALYEIKLKPNYSQTNNLARIKVAYQKPINDRVITLNKDVPPSILRKNIDDSSSDMKLSTAVAAFAEKLKHSYWSRLYDYDDILQLIKNLPASYLRKNQIHDLKMAIREASILDDRNDPYENQYPLSSINFDHIPLLQ